jgi:hypothetical protein
MFEKKFGCSMPFIKAFEAIKTLISHKGPGYQLNPIHSKPSCFTASGGNKGILKTVKAV